MRLGIKDKAFVVQNTMDQSVLPFVSDIDVSEQNVKDGVAHVLTAPDWIVLSPNKYSLFFFQQRNSILWETHYQITKAGRGLSHDAGKKAFTWMFENTGCLKIVGYTSIKKAVTFAMDLGFKIEGKLKGAWLKAGILHDLTIIGLKRGDLCLGCQQQ